MTVSEAFAKFIYRELFHFVCVPCFLWSALWQIQTRIMKTILRKKSIKNSKTLCQSCTLYCLFTWSVPNPQILYSTFTFTPFYNNSLTFCRRGFGKCKQYSPKINIESIVWLDKTSSLMTSSWIFRFRFRCLVHQLRKYSMSIWRLVRTS